jgi:predicted N-formylglutamate amidohydrolase
MPSNHPDHTIRGLPLIGPDDPPPFALLLEHGGAPALVVCDHASRAFPRSLNRLGLPELPSWQHIAWDIGAAELARGISSALDAPAVLAGYSRLVVDCNRRPDDPEAFREVSDGWMIPGNQSLTDAERRVRLGSLFDPYHEAIAAMLGAFRARDVVPLLVSVHTFTPVMGGEPRPWHVGVLWDKDEATARRMLDGLRDVEGLVVGDNEPYSGKHPSDYTVEQHAESAGLPHVCLEVRQDQLESPAGTERWVRILAKLVDQLLRDPALRRLRDGESTWRRANRR